MTKKAEDTTVESTTEETAATTEEQSTASELNQERALAREEKSLMKQLEEMEKVKLTIPEDQNNPDDVVPITWNGITYAIPRGIEFDVPVVFRDIWQESYAKTQEVNKRVRDSVKKEIKIM